MAGAIARLIQEIIDQRSDGNQAVMHFTRVKIVMKGINPDDFSESSADDPEILSRLKVVAEELGLKL